MEAPALPLLLDTHLLLWLAVDPDRLPEVLREELADRRSRRPIAWRCSIFP
jgi:PIN domain nuclease of toxin-antitoxin system